MTGMEYLFQKKSERTYYEQINKFLNHHHKKSGKKKRISTEEFDTNLDIMVLKIEKNSAKKRLLSENVTNMNNSGSNLIDSDFVNLQKLKMNFDQTIKLTPYLMSDKKQFLIKGTLNSKPINLCIPHNTILGI